MRFTIAAVLGVSLAACAAPAAPGGKSTEEPAALYTSAAPREDVNCARPVEARDPAAEGPPVGFDPLGGGQTFFYEGGRVFAERGRPSRDVLRLVPSS